MKAIWNGVTLAESSDIIVIERNHYFPPDSINNQYFAPGTKTTICPWKGTASYYSLDINGNENRDVAWYYPQPKSAAAEICDYVAFWRGVDVIE